MQADWRALNEVIEEKKNEEQIKAEPKNVQNFRKAVNQKVRDYKKGIKSVKDKEASRDKYLNAIKDMRDKALRVATQDETKAAMEEAYNNAIDEITRAYDEVTAKNTQNSAQAESAQNENVASEATTEKPQTKKAAENGGQENEGEASNTESNETDKGGVVVTGNEFGEYADIKELRKKAIDFYRENLQGTSVVNEAVGKIDIDENGIVEFTTEGRQKVKANSANEETLLLIKYLPELIKNAKIVEHKDATSEKHKKLGNSFYYLTTSYIRDGKITPLEITLKKLHTGDIHYYNHTINPKEYTKNAPVSPRTESSNKEANVSKADGAFIDSTIPQTEPIGKDKNKLISRIEKEIQKHKGGKLSNLEMTRKLNLELKRIADFKRNTTNSQRLAMLDDAEKLVKNYLQEIEQKQERSQNEDAFSDGKLNQDTRGIYDTTNKIITLTESADESTFIHEMSHHYLNELEQIAKIAGENSQAARDLQEINKWANWEDGMAAEYEDTASEKEFAELEKEILSAEEKGDTKKAEELKERWKQERFARGVEEYLSEGIAPTAKLKKIFDNFKNWLKEIYRGLRGAGAKPSDDVQAVMERMFASDKEILSGRSSRLTGDTKAAYDKALADLKAAGVKNAEANAYLAAKMAERLKTAYEEKGQSVSVLSLLPEIRAQEKSAQNEKEAVRKKYEGTKKWLKAPNGEDTNLTEEQWLTVMTSAFKKWFGDWENDPKNASQVVDENGEPLVVYHGTDAEFTTFQRVIPKHGLELGDGFYFTSDKTISSAYGKNVIGAFLNIRSPFERDTVINKNAVFSDREKARKFFSDKMNDWKINGKGYARFKPIAKKNDRNEYIITYPTDYQIEPSERNDGIITKDQIVVFNPNQIKSATDNNGEFDANDPSILHQKSSKSPIEENVGMGDNVINDYLTIKSNGSFAVKLLREKPPLRTETQQERIHRRKEEVSNMDKLLDLKNNPDAYAELLSDYLVNGVEKQLVKFKDYQELAKVYKLRYNKVLANYSEGVSEEAVVASLFTLKGVIRYAEQEGNITRNVRTDVESRFNGRRSLSEVERNGKSSGQLNTPSETKHSKTGAFSIAEKGGKFNVELNTESLDKSKLDNLKTLVDSYNGKISDKGVSFTFDDKSTLDKFMQVSEAYLSTTDEDTKAKASNAVEIIEKFSAEKLKENAIAKLAANAKIINAKDLTTAEKKFTEMGDKLGAPVVWVDADPRLNGWHKGGVTFINRNRRMSGEKTFWHESLHFIVQNEEKLLGELAEAVNISGKQIEAWKDKTGRYELSDNEVI